MARGGYRPGSGRKPKISADAAAARIDAETPLAYLLSIMRDPNADPARRDRAAQVAAPFCHARAAGTPSSYNYVTKKADATKKARFAGYGSSWWGLLHSETEREQREAELAADPELRRWVEAEVMGEGDRHPPVRPDPKPAPEVKPKVDDADERWERYLRDDEPPTDWTNPDTGESDLEFRGGLPYRGPPDDE